MPRTSKPQSYYDDIKTKFKEERDKRLTYRPPGTTQYTSELTGELEKYSTDPWRKEAPDREPINDQVEVLFIGGAFPRYSHLAACTSAASRISGLLSGAPMWAVPGIGIATQVRHVMW